MNCSVNLTHSISLATKILSEKQKQYNTYYILIYISLLLWCTLCNVIAFKSINNFFFQLPTQSFFCLRSGSSPAKTSWWNGFHARRTLEDELTLQFCPLWSYPQSPRLSEGKGNEVNIVLLFVSSDSKRSGDRITLTTELWGQQPKC